MQETVQHERGIAWTLVTLGLVTANSTAFRDLQSMSDVQSRQVADELYTIRPSAATTKAGGPLSSQRLVQVCKSRSV